jgi:hypothetical protein
MTTECVTPDEPVQWRGYDAILSMLFTRASQTIERVQVYAQIERRLVALSIHGRFALIYGGEDCKLGCCKCYDSYLQLLLQGLSQTVSPDEIWPLVDRRIALLGGAREPISECTVSRTARCRYESSN